MPKKYYVTMETKNHRFTEDFSKCVALRVQMRPRENYVSKKNCAGKSLIQKIICDFFYHSVGSPNAQGQQL